jgi:hypothetical protein
MKKYAWVKEAFRINDPNPKLPALSLPITPTLPTTQITLKSSHRK